MASTNNVQAYNEAVRYLQATVLCVATSPFI